MMQWEYCYEQCRLVCGFGYLRGLLTIYPMGIIGRTGLVLKFHLAEPLKVFVLYKESIKVRIMRKN